MAESQQILFGSPVGQPPASPPTRTEGWPWWTAPAALVAAIVLASMAAVLVDIPMALVGGVSITSSHLPPALELVDTVVQDCAFVGAAVLFAHITTRTVSAWQFGLRPPRLSWRACAVLVVALIVGFLIFNVIWAEVVNVSTKEKVLEQLGADEGTALLLLSAALTCVMAPICEELLFRGFIYKALCNLRGPWLAAVLTGVVFGGVHAGSAPAVDLVPLGVLGFGLCLLYRRTGSLYPCIAAHSLNNSIAFGASEHWGWQIPVLMAAALGLIALLAAAFKRAGVITPPPASSVGGSPTVVVSTA